MKTKIYIRGYGKLPYRFSKEKIEEIFESVFGGSCQEQDLFILETCRNLLLEKIDSVPIPEDKADNAYLLSERRENLFQLNKAIDKVVEHVLEMNSNSRLVIQLENQ
jgi:hypothetical protein